MATSFQDLVVLKVFLSIFCSQARPVGIHITTLPNGLVSPCHESKSFSSWNSDSSFVWYRKRTWAALIIAGGEVLRMCCLVNLTIPQVSAECSAVESRVRQHLQNTTTTQQYRVRRNVGIFLNIRKSHSLKN